MIAYLVAVGVFVWFWQRYNGGGLPTSSEELANLLDSKAVYPIAAFVGIAIVMQVIRRKGWDNRSRFERWIRAQSYGLTNRRLLVLTGDEIEDELGPDDFAEPRVRDRGNGYADLELKEQSGDTGRRTTALERERLKVVFRAIPDAEHVKQKIEDWRRHFRLREEEDAKAFLDGPAMPSQRTATASGVRTLRNDRFGVTLSLPDAWAVKVRKRRKPYGKVFLDFERWTSPEELLDWNVLKAEGDYLTAFEMHLDQVRQPVIRYEKAKNSALINAISGEIVESDGNLRRENFEGFAITRKHVDRRPDQNGGDRTRPAFHRWMVLHDGQLQIGLTMVWPEDSETLKRVVDKIYESIKVD